MYQFFFHGLYYSYCIYNLSPTPRSHRFFSFVFHQMFYSTKFIFRSVAHFEFLFMEDVSMYIDFIFFTFFRQLFQHIKKKKTISSFNGLCSFVKDQLNMFAWVSFWAQYSVTLSYVSVFLPIPYYLDYFRFIINFKMGRVSAPPWCFFFSIAQDILSLSPSHTNLESVPQNPKGNLLVFSCGLC